MKLQSRFAGWLCLLLLTTLSATAAGYETVLLGKQKAVANRVLARFKTDVAAPDRNKALDSQRARVLREYGLVSDLVAIELLPSPRPNAVVPAPVKNTADPGKELLRRIKALQDTGAFVYVEPDYIVTASATPSDASYQNGTLWGLNNTGQNGGVAGADISAPAAWDITTGSANVIVGVIDSGIRYTHQDLAARMWTNPGEIPGNGIDDDGDGYIDNVYGINAIIDSGDPMDDNDHGTHVAGTIGAQANGGGPHVGVAWNVRLMALKFLDANGSGSTSDAVQCIDFGRQKGARILNNSWGGGGYSQSLVDAIIAARNAGILFVAAAGNESNNNDAFPSYPATYEVDNVISVAAVNRADQLANFSNRGASTVHLGAPGVDIFSSTSGSNTEYKTFNGTSMAAPHVAGVAALIWSAFPAATLAEVRQRLLVGVVPIPALNGQTITGGRLNALNSLTAGADGTLEISVNVPGGLQVNPGATVPVRVRVTDLVAINNATVTGTLSTGGNLTFVNNGTGPDPAANDNEYSAQLTVPNGVGSFTVNLTASAAGKEPASAVVLFTVTVPPANDLFANRALITSLPALRTGSNRNATFEPGEPDLDSDGSGSSVWWSWTAPQAGVAIATTAGSNFDTLLGVYTGTSVAGLTLVRSNDDATGVFTSTVLFRTVGGTTYHFLVDGYAGDQGDIQFNLELDTTLSNDHFANRTPLSGIDFTVSGYNLGATAEPGEPIHNGLDPDRSVWWEWDSGSLSGPVIVSTSGSSFDTHVAVYRGAQLNGLTFVAGNDDVAPRLFQSEVRFNALPGTRYQIVVDSAWIDDGQVQLTIARQADNDAFEAARLLTGEFVQDVGLNLGAGGQTGEPFYDPEYDDAKSVWWRWTAPRSGNVTITTDGSTFDTTLDIFTGSVIHQLVPVAFNDDRSSRVYTSLVSFGAQAGVTYHIRVNGYYYFEEDSFGDLLWWWVDAGRVNLLVSMDGASELSLPEFRTDGTLALELTGEPERPYVLSATPSLGIPWVPVATNTPVSRRVIFSQPTASGETRFFRAQPASLIGGE
jgi:subtilisin family serine protease